MTQHRYSCWVVLVLVDHRYDLLITKTHNRIAIRVYLKLAIDKESESCLVTTTPQAASATLIMQLEINQSPLLEFYSQASILNDLGTYSVLSLKVLMMEREKFLQA